MNAPVHSKPRAVDWEALKRRITEAIEQTEAFLDPNRPDAATRVPPSTACDSGEAEGDGLEHPTEVVTFALSGQRFALEIRYVWEILLVQRLSPLPGTPSYLLGIYDLRGQLLPIFDLRGLLGLSGATRSDPAWAIVCGETHSEFLVLSDDTPEVGEIAAGEIAAPRGMNRPWTRAMTADGTAVLDGALLLSDRRLFLDSEDPAASGNGEGEA
ncbi:purine-binding chemotaxis protein CheW [Sinorhizobium kostiense]|uniref:Purine-binding chemotaxis protein CheW n=1 Tax=Sinorhizobium kostiense TaxID=76747 RepID=A0ABS4QTC8_9HYPH|nr:chemotaxis protein CheW [Sinorhizobium kostiense]MBP2233888.1 purine-binding chemotaxis protein CheW [Sinorhizobium kostiense]